MAPPTINDVALISQPIPDRFTQLEMLRMRRQGWAYPEIAEAFGFKDQAEAAKYVIGLLNELVLENAKQVRKLEVDRLDSMLKAVWAKAALGRVDAVKIVLKIMERRAAYLGLDAPKRVDITTQVRELAVELGVDPDLAVLEAEAIIRERSEYAPDDE